MASLESMRELYEMRNLLHLWASRAEVKENESAWGHLFTAFRAVENATNALASCTDMEMRAILDEPSDSND